MTLAFASDMLSDTLSNPVETANVAADLPAWSRAGHPVAKAVYRRKEGVAFAGAFVVRVDEFYEPEQERCRWRVRAYDRHTGSVGWEQLGEERRGHELIDTLAVHGDRLFVVGAVSWGGCHENLLVRCYDTTKGTILWEDEVIGVHGDPRSQNLVVFEGSIIVTGRDMTTQACVARAYSPAGKLLWSQSEASNSPLDTWF